MSSSIEQLRIAHRLALRAQHASEFNAGALVRAWPRVASSAFAAHRSLPETGDSEDRVVERIALDARSLSQSIERRSWPSAGGHDLALMQVAAAFDRATAGRGLPPVSGKDADEAHMLITSSLWVTSQLIGRTVRDHVYDIRLDRKISDTTRNLVTPTATEIHRRFNAIEQLAAGALRGQTQPAGDVVAQLRRSVATWDIQAHRALARNRSTTVLHVLAHHEAVSVTAFGNFVDQARDRHLIDPFTAERLRPVLVDSATSWARLRDIAAEFSFATTRIPVTFVNAATDLRERLQDAVQLSTPRDHAPILSALSGHLASGVTIAAAARDLIGDGELRAPARAIARSINKQPGTTQTVIDAHAIHRGLSLPLPPEARRLLDEPMGRVLQDAHEALNRGATLDVLDHKPPTNARPAEPITTHDHHRPPIPPSLTPHTEASGPTP